MKIVSFNVNGIRAILQKNFKEDFFNLNADIFSLNETKFSETSHDHFPFEPDGYHVYWTNSKVRKGYSGVAVFTKIMPLSIRYGLENGEYDDEGRVITLEFDSFYYVACYVPNAGDELKRMGYRLLFEERILQYLTKLSMQKNVIYAGDLNVAHQPMDLKNPKMNENNAGYTLEERTAFTHLLDAGFIDTFRYLNPDKIQYTWWSYRFNARMNNAGWRIDYFIVNKDFLPRIKNVILHNEIMGSDHCPIEVNIDL